MSGLGVRESLTAPAWAREPFPARNGIRSRRGAPVAYALGMEPYTPVELARLLGYSNEARPGLVVRNYLRATYPDHVKNARWELTEAEATDVMANVPRAQLGIDS